MMPSGETPKSKGGRPPKYAGEGRRPTVTFRCRGSLQEVLQSAAQEADRSLSEEIERRLERSFAYQQRDAFEAALLGGGKKSFMFRVLAELLLPFELDQPKSSYVMERSFVSGLVFGALLEIFPDRPPLMPEIEITEETEKGMKTLFSEGLARGRTIAAFRILESFSKPISEVVLMSKGPSPEGKAWWDKLGPAIGGRLLEEGLRPDAPPTGPAPEFDLWPKPKPKRKTKS